MITLDFHTRWCNVFHKKRNIGSKPSSSTVHIVDEESLAKKSLQSLSAKRRDTIASTTTGGDKQTMGGTTESRQLDTIREYLNRQS